jgi:hypothetical protein
MQDILVGDLLGAIDQNGIVPLMHYPAGQSIAYFNQVRSVADVVRGLVEESERGLARLARAAAAD